VRGNDGDDNLDGGAGTDTGNGGPVAGIDVCTTMEILINC
jgi:hypothetical protein